eukprot:753586-Hanusia_phi.AAC.2
MKFRLEKTCPFRKSREENTVPFLKTTVGTNASVFNALHMQHQDKRILHAARPTPPRPGSR